MERFLATSVMLLAVLQAQAMFTGAYHVSLRTDWERLGAYCQQEINQLYSDVTRPSASPAPEATSAAPETARKPRDKALFIDSAASEDAAATQKTGE